MSELKKVSIEQLVSELKNRRKKIKETLKPKQIENPDLTRLRRICQEYIDCLDSEEYCDDDTKHYIYEEALMSIFGRDVFDWKNKRHG